ncbi:MAG TPA: PQQ-binding-like beta-propeller repeat protein [Pseudonocardiaceae bacterium]|nr:PQQ-binding-like beta-propeller repeat protein [Pseudonocardiaceae bacterium]
MASGDIDPAPDGDPLADIAPLSDLGPLSEVVPLGDVFYFTDSDDDYPPPPPRRPVRPVGRPVVGSTLTGLGLVGTVVAAGLPWSGAQGLVGIRSLLATASWLMWLLITVAAALVIGVVVLARPRRRGLWWGAATALAAAALSGYAVVALPTDRSVGPGPGLACVALVVLAVGQVLAVLSRQVGPRWQWRPAGIAAGVAVVVLAAAGFASVRLVDASDIDATTASGPVTPVTGDPPSTVDTLVWRKYLTVFDVAGSSALVAGRVQHGDAAMAGVSILDLRTGRERWHHYERGWTVQETGLTGDGSTALVVINTANGVDAVGFDAAAGTLRWRQHLAAGFDCAAPKPGQIQPIGGCSGQLITGDGLLYVTAGIDPTMTGAPVTYLAARDGRTWPVRIGTDCRVRGAGADAGGVYVLEQCVSPGFPEPHLLSEQVAGYDLTGRQRWSSPLDLVRGTVAGQLGPVFVRGDVVLAEQEQRYVALDAATGAQLWTTTDGFEPETTVTDGSRLAWASGVDVVTLDLHTGDQLWQRSWEFPEEADLPAIAAGKLYLIKHTIGPNPYTCAEHAQLLLLDPATGHDTLAGSGLPGGAGNDCGPDVQDRTFLRGGLVVLVTANTITVLSGH